MFAVPPELSDPAALVIAAALAAGCAGIPGLFLRRPGSGQLFAAGLTMLSALAGMYAAGALLAHGVTSTFVLSWGLPFGPCELAVDPLSALFLLPIFLISGVGSLFALGYWPAHERRDSEPQLTFFYGVLSSSMALLVLARNMALFIVLWEVMALSAFFLLVAEHERRDVRRAGAVYLLATHAGSAMLLIFFSLLVAETGSYLFPAGGALSAGAPLAMAMAVSAFIGFGAKAGIMPLHIWLPSAHANAPSHVSAMMSGVMLKMGLYGLLRALSFFHDIPLSWGVFLVAAGIISALLGIAAAVAQRDLKRLLACSSIENIGIITTGIGMALVGTAIHDSRLAYLGMAGALLHVLNHSCFKPLLFLASGVIIHTRGTRDMNLLGGLARCMPRTALLVLTGSVAICGIPPLNGFISEALLYFGFFSRLRDPGAIGLVLMAPLLALVGGLAVIAFVKFYGSVFLGAPRRQPDGHEHEPGAAMLVPMKLLALLCLAIGLAPQWVLRLLTPAIAVCVPSGELMPHARECVALLGQYSRAGLLLILTGAAVLLFWRQCLRRSRLESADTWGCGYLRATPRIQYTATSFTEMAVSVFNGVVEQKIERPQVAGLFPRSGRCLDVPTETVLERIIAPCFTLAGAVCALLMRLQHGRMHFYMLYIFATLVLLMLWAH